MNYKISTYVLAAILAAVTFSKCSEGKQDEQENSASASGTFEGSDSLDEGLDSLFSADDFRKIDPDLTSDFINFDSTQKQTERYRKHRDSNGNGALKREPYGFGFGLNKVKRLIQIYENANQTLPADSAITGIRIYMTHRWTDLGPGRGKRKHIDLVMVPAMRSGRNLIPIGDPENGKKMTDRLIDKKSLSTETPFLNTSAPCPNLCQ